MPSRRTILTSAAAGAGVIALGAVGAQALAQSAGGASPRQVYVDRHSVYSNIMALQYLLNAYGIKAKADGSYGPQTKTAVARFQSAHHLSKDGSAGPATMKTMIGGKNVAAHNGWPNKNTVKAIQQLLYKIGYQVKTDGSFGAATNSSVRHFQSKHKLPITGTVDYATWTFLFNPPAAPGSGVRKGPAVLVSQAGTGLASWAHDCGPAAFVAVELRLGRKPGHWTSVSHRGDAIHYARRTNLHMYNDSQGTSQVKGASGVTAGFHRAGVSQAKTGDFAAATKALRSGGVAMLGGDLKVAAAWNGRGTSSVSHWIALLDYKSSSGKYLVSEPSSSHNKLVWVSGNQLTSFARSWGASVYIG
ncbi:MAG TPA: peptidoglycan-binding protein [Stackebrandtia sp.]|jgi:peptidoglycan hydrolase-like protein with peptidoglycan-binding domain|uniref:peptidoglycan-binding domain-containing protein n=1 Tax=Stackebrandtia sp. TaxID=2023065 RepID=UPI002D63FDBC|nr:peptidoglycan-binding protein [Stackebrandtia sp.]HZE40035.1 peptidoglycan-binding protein [Stackebrandtia sp.]